LKMKKITRISLLFIFVLTCLLLSFAPAIAQISGIPVVVVLTSEGPITPVMINYLERGIRIAEERGAQALILELDTPGGSITLMNEIVQVIRNSDIPVVVYVYPRNAMAASAGTVITLAGHLAAMAPETTIGAASPVGSEGEDLGQTMESKEKEILKASVRGLTKNRSAEATKLAEDTIENAKAVTVEEALAVGLVDIQANDIGDLIQQLNGRSVIVKDNQLTLNTENAEVIVVENTLIEGILLLLVNPNLVFLLLSVGVQAILIEISSPGGWVAGFLGAVCILLAVYGLGILPVNWFGILFLLVSFVLFILDIKAPTHGALTPAGVGSFIVGALVLFNSPGTPQFQRVSVPLVVGMGFFLGAIFFGILLIGIRVLHNPAQMGVKSMLGKTGTAKTSVGDAGQVMLGSELWSAEKSPESGKIGKGDLVEVVEVRGLRLIVKKK
jgi:membrane-bound serine protease (ClpP class)